MPGLSSLAINLRAAASSPRLWWLSRQSIVRYGAIQFIDECTEFMSMVNAIKPKTVLEIGTAQGGFFWLLCRVSSPLATLISLDLPTAERYSGGRRADVDLAPLKQPDQTVHAIQGNSHDPNILGRVKSLLNGRQIDLLFIDGDHTYDGALRLRNVQPPRQIGRHRWLSRHRPQPAGMRSAPVLA
jgi:cephalosporin hydroxylase